MWQPWSTRPGCVEANVVYLTPGQGLPNLTINGHFQFPAQASLADVAHDICNRGCHPCSAEALTVFARPLQYLPGGPADASDALDSESDNDVIVTEDDAAPDATAAASGSAVPGAPTAVEDTETSDVVIPELSHAQRDQLAHQVQSQLLRLIDIFDANDAADPFASAIGAMEEVLAGVDRTSLSMFRAARELNRSVPAETDWT